MRVIVQDRLRLGNELFRTMSAVWLAAAVGAERVEGVALPEFGLETPVAGPPRNPFLTGLVFPTNLAFPMEALRLVLDRFPPDAIVDGTLGMRMEYFEPQLRFWRSVVAKPGLTVPEIGDGEALVHVRAGDILDGEHRGYYPLPLDFYDRVLDDLGKTPVFVGELDADHPYLDALRRRHPGARFLAGTVEEDFELLRRARCKILSISSFAWLAAWLGDDDTRVVTPVGGQQNPAMWPLVNLLPVDDGRFAFRWLGDVERWRGEPLDRFHARLEGAPLGYPVRRPEPVPLPEPVFGGDPRRLVPFRTPDEWCQFAAAAMGR